ncbi:MAG: preprotein translocase subunit SecE [Proteobacteria bacterium]|nr:preprotein translocase subunit SecE [Pseudomonadota bacterium]
MWEKIKQFLREVRTELGKVTWPTRKEILAATGVVVVFVIIISIYLGLVDLIISRVIRTFLW